MFWRGSGASIGKTAAELRHLVRQPEGRREFTFEHLLSRTGARSGAVLAAALDEVISEGLLLERYRVSSRESGGGIADFESPADLPPEIHDWRTDQYVEVDPSMVTVIYLTPEQ